MSDIPVTDDDGIEPPDNVASLTEFRLGRNSSLKGLYV